MPILVQKYGGSSVADESKIALVADRVVEAKKEGFDLVVVVSAMGKTTDELLALAHRINPDPPRREQDMLATVGERITMSLLSMAIAKRGVQAISFTGSQCGIITNDRHADARIIEVRPYRIQDELSRGKVVIVAGFQGMSYRREITSLGRGGSDTTAVALAAALGAESCTIFGDVDGVYSADPAIIHSPKRIEELSYPEMQELSESGAKVLNSTAVEFAKEQKIALFVKRNDGTGGQTAIRKHTPLSPGMVVGIAHEESVRTISCHGQQPDLEDLLAFLDELSIPGKQLTVDRFAGQRRISLVVSREFLPDPSSCRVQLEDRFGDSVELRDDIGAVSLIGSGINQSFVNLQKAHSLLQVKNIEATGWNTSSFRITMLVPSNQLQATVELMHREFVESR